MSKLGFTKLWPMIIVGLLFALSACNDEGSLSIRSFQNISDGTILVSVSDMDSNGRIDVRQENEDGSIGDLIGSASVERGSGGVSVKLDPTKATDFLRIILFSEAGDPIDVESVLVEGIEEGLATSQTTSSPTSVPDSPTSTPVPETVDLAPSPAAGEEEQSSSYAYMPFQLTDAIAEMLSKLSGDGESDLVPVVKDDFSSPGWYEFEDEFGEAKHVDGTYELSVKPGVRQGALGFPEFDISYAEIFPIQDFYVQTWVAGFCPADNASGFSIRESEKGFYEFLIRPSGSFAILKFAGGPPEPIVDWTVSSAIVQGEGAFNALGVYANGSDFAFDINGERVFSFMDPDLTGGGISLRVEVYDEGGSQHRFDNFAIWDF